MEQLTLPAILAASPAPWRSQVNFDGVGGCRMIDANNVEVPLLSIVAFSGIMSATIALKQAEAAHATQGARAAQAAQYAQQQEAAAS
jgi:hypothetical protein